MNREQLVIRHAEFPTLLIDLSYRNVVIHKMIDAYVHGAIATKEEAYCQMIIELAKTRDELMQRAADAAHMSLSLGVSKLK